MRRMQVLTAAALVCLSGTAFAQHAAENTDNRSRPATGQPASIDGVHQRDLELIPTEWVVGQKVLDQNREKRLGMIKDLILDTHDGHVVYALVNRSPREDGGMPALVAVPWLALTWDSDNRLLTMPISRDRIAEAKAFEVKRWDTLNDPAWRDETYGYFDVDPDAYDEGWQDPGDDEAKNPADPANGASPTRDPGAVHTPDNEQDRHPTDHGNPSQPDRDADDRDDANDNRVDEPHRDARSIAADNPTQYVLASKIVGQTLRGAEDKEIGDVDALVIDASSGRMAFIVAEFGGFLGIGDSKVAFPWDYFKVNDEGHLYTNEVKAEEVRTAPRIERADWSELRDEDFGPRVYKHFGRDAEWFGTGFGGQQTRGDQADYDQLYTSGTDADATGTVSRIAEDDGVRTVIITTDSGDRLVHLAPVSYMDKSGCSLHEGDRVTIRGRTVMIDGKQVLIASSIKGADNKTWELRSSDGEHKWTDAR